MTKDLQTQFLKQLATDRTFQADLKNSHGLEKAHKVVVKAGYEVTFEDFKTGMEQLRAAVHRDTGELSENDLEMVAGGRDTDFAQDVADFVVGIVEAIFT